MRLTSWTTAAGSFLVLRLQKTNLLLPYELDPCAVLPSSALCELFDTSNSLGLLADVCHVVLLSSPLELLALPDLLTAWPQEELPDIYCTGDCLNVAWQLHEDRSNPGCCTLDGEDEWQDAEHAAGNTQSWTAEQILKAAKVATYGEVCFINDSDVCATAHPSGMGIGCAVWVMSTPSCRLGYVSHASLHHPCAAVLPPAAIHNLDALVLGPSCMAAAEQMPGSVQTLLNEVTHRVVNTLRRGGNVLLPVLLTGTLLPLLEQIPAALLAARLAGAMPVIYVAPAATRALLVGATCAECLNDVRLQQVMASQKPFAYDMAIQAGHVMVGESLADAAIQSAWKTPMCVLVSVSSLTQGAGSQLVKKWAHEPRSHVLFTDSTGLQSAQHVLHAQLPPDFQLKVCGPSSSVGLSYVELSRVLDAARPKRLLLPSAVLGGLRRLPAHSRGVLASEDVHAYHPFETLKIHTPKLALSAIMPAQIAATTKMQELTQQFAVTRIACNLVYEDDAWRLLLSNPHDPSSRDPRTGPLCQPCLLGEVALQQVVQALEDQGAEVDMILEHNQDGGITVLQVLNWAGEIRLSSSMTVINAENPRVRQQLAKAVISSLQSL